MFPLDLTLTISHHLGATMICSPSVLSMDPIMATWDTVCVCVVFSVVPL